ncbi:P-loop containing nucleoside triphosphate hydrolase protein [Tricholoma matsutake]|nr:P-loop containing nucleoside triphosphate hydrolase protein [Tricholoma matsutake 945]
MQHMIKDFEEFFRSKEWYLRRSIPYRRGYLMHGPPGCGKTSTIRLLAGIFNLDIYIISLSMSGMDDTLLGELLCGLPARCIVAIEDIDAAFTHGVNRDESYSHAETNMKPSIHRSRVTLSGILNALDGVGAQEGRITIATTNKYHTLDQALVRPGRMDVHLEFKNASKYQARKLFTHFYLPGEEDTDSISVAPVDSTAVASALTASTSDASDVDMLAEKPSSTDNSEPDKEEIQDLADRFSNAIPEYELSMASLQGYLMLYKMRPSDAVKEVVNWVNKERVIHAVTKNKTSQDTHNTLAPAPPLTPANPPISPSLEGTRV